MWDEANASHMPVHTKLNHWVRKLNKEVHYMRTSWYGYGNGSFMNTGKLYPRFLGL